MSVITAAIPDNLVYVDGVAHAVDLSALAKRGIHYVSWDGSRGQVQHEDRGPFDTVPNRYIASFDEFEHLIGEYKKSAATHAKKQKDEKAARDAEIALLEAEFIEKKKKVEAEVKKFNEDILTRTRARAAAAKAKHENALAEARARAAAEKAK